MNPLNRDATRLFAYHEATKHTLERLMAEPHWLDWSNMPEPFRHYEGVPVVDLPADPPPPAIPALEVLCGKRGERTAGSGAEFLSRLLYYSAAISAGKRVPGTGFRYALRVNPSSGNLHPTEFHFATRGLAAWDDGLYHYRASSHMAEQRGRGDFATRLLELAQAPWFRAAPVVFVLSNIAWREAWKYRSRAYRYCLHDLGHAWQSLALAARAMDCEAHAFGHFPDDAVAEWCGLEDEWPMLVVAIDGPVVPVEERETRTRDWLGGKPNRLSLEIVPYPLIDAIHLASKLETDDGPIPQPDAAPSGGGRIDLRAAAESGESFGLVTRRRRSALDFRGGSESISFEQLSTLLDAALRPFAADFEADLFGAPPAHFVQLFLYVHRVRDLAPGVYRHWPGQLELVSAGDQRVAAAGLSLGQDLAGNACFAVSMIADLERAARLYGNRGYRYAHFEAGAIGQRLYLAAEALGFQSTGIGAFHDDQVHRYLQIPPDQGQVIYHFACGYAVKDDRLEG